MLFNNINLLDGKWFYISLKIVSEIKKHFV